jgi:hypothetical protein
LTPIINLVSHFISNIYSVQIGSISYKLIATLQSNPVYPGIQLQAYPPGGFSIQDPPFLQDEAVQYVSNLSQSVPVYPTGQ